MEIPAISTSRRFPRISRWISTTFAPVTRTSNESRRQSLIITRINSSLGTYSWRMSIRIYTKRTEVDDFSTELSGAERHKIMSLHVKRINRKEDEEENVSGEGG